MGSNQTKYRVKYCRVSLQTLCLEKTLIPNQETKNLYSPRKFIIENLYDLLNFQILLQIRETNGVKYIVKQEVKMKTSRAPPNLMRRVRIPRPNCSTSTDSKHQSV